MVMAKFTVIWRDDGDDFMTTVVELGDDRDPHSINNNEWADLACAAEYDDNEYAAEDTDEYLPSRDGYELITVIVGEPEYIY
jgi:hypothetical protein